MEMVNCTFCEEDINALFFYCPFCGTENKEQNGGLDYFEASQIIKGHIKCKECGLYHRGNNNCPWCGVYYKEEPEDYEHLGVKEPVTEIMDWDKSLEEENEY